MELGLEEGKRVHERDLMLQQGRAWSPDLPAFSPSWPLRDTHAGSSHRQLREPKIGTVLGPSPGLPA